MTVKELKERLSNSDENKEVIIRFCLSNEDEIGYVLEPILVSSRISDIAIYAEYTMTEEDCVFIGQKDLRKLWEEN